MKGRFINGWVAISEFHENQIRKYSKENPDTPFDIKPVLPESSKLRGYFEGGLCPLVAYFHEGMDHRNNKDIKKVREWLKTEFNGEMVELNGKVHTITNSTKVGLAGFVERVVGYIDENYAPPKECMDSAKYKYWRDTIYPFASLSKADNYIDYLSEIGILK